MDEGNEHWEIVVVGAGAAGLLAALTAARGGRRVLLLESTKDGGRKILISGGGRCNILPSEAAPERYVTDSSAHTLRKMLRAWPLSEQIDFFTQELGQRLVREPETGKLFPESNRARDVRDRLVTRTREAGGHLRFGERVTRLARAAPNSKGRWRVTTATQRTIDADAVIIATGGLSVPATGSSGWGLECLDRLGVEMNPTYPALTPLVLDPPVHNHLAGVSLSVSIRAVGARPKLVTHGGFLFTHRGYSGPTVLDVSHCAVRARARNEPAGLIVQWSQMSAEKWDEGLRQGRTSVGTILERKLPKRLSSQLLTEAGIESSTRVAQLGRAARKRLVALLCSYSLQSTGDEGYKKAEVTGGGVALSAVDPRTLELRTHPGLFVCGEILDAFGPIGGHNFMWAWATGRSAGRGALSLVATVEETT